MPEQNEVPETFRISDAMWERIKPLLPVHPPNPKVGRPHNDDRRVMDAIFFALTVPMSCLTGA